MSAPLRLFLLLLWLVPSAWAQNNAPIGVQDLYHVETNQVLSVPAASGVLSNDYDPDGDTFFLSSGILPDHGDLAFAGGGAFTYTPDTDFVGTDTFGYRISDGSLTTSLVTVTVEVLPSPNRAPVAVPDAYTTPFETALSVTGAEGLLTNDYDPDGDTIFVGSFTSPANGSVSVNINSGAFTYTPNTGFSGTDSFQYRIRDPAFSISSLVDVFIGVGVDTVLPVELVRFEAVRDGNAVRLSWDTASETNNAGFEVERAVNGHAFATLGFVEGHGTSTAPKTYTFTDITLPFEGKGLTYRLKQVDFDGTVDYSPLVELDLQAPDAVALHENFPNPFREVTTIRYELPRDTAVRLAVYDVQGREVASLVDGAQAAGRHAIPFHAEGLPSGLYFYRLVTDDGRQQSGQMLLAH